MGTYNPIGLALRDVGASFGNLLEADARRRDQALQREVALGQLGVQRAQIESEAPVALARVGVQQSEAELRRNQFERNFELAQGTQTEQRLQNVRQNALAEQGLEIQRGTLGVAQGNLGVARAAEARQGRYLEQVQIPEAQARIGLVQVQQEQIKALTAQQEMVNKGNMQEVNVTELIRTLSGNDPQAAQYGTLVYSLYAHPNEKGYLRTDDQGNVYAPVGLINQRLQALKPVLEYFRKETASDQEIYKAATDSYKALADVDKAATPFNVHLAQTAALIRNRGPYFQAINTLETEQRKQLEDQVLAKFRAENNGREPRRSADPAKDEFKTRIEPGIAEALARAKAKIAFEYGGGILPQAPSGAAPSTSTTPSPTPAPGAQTPRVQLEQVTAQAAVEARLNPAVVQGLFAGESGYRNVANQQYGPRSGVGPAQLVPSTFREFARPGEDINNPSDNIRVGTRYFASLVQRYGGDVRRAYAAYNAGPGNVPLEGPIPEQVTVQGITVYPRAFADRIVREARRYNPEAVSVGVPGRGGVPVAQGGLSLPTLEPQPQQLRRNAETTLRSRFDGRLPNGTHALRYLGRDYAVTTDGGRITEIVPGGVGTPSEAPSPVSGTAPLDPVYVPPPTERPSLATIGGRLFPGLVPRQ